MITADNYVITLDRDMLAMLDDKTPKKGEAITRLQAFRYLLENAADNPHETIFRGTRLICDRGQLVTSVASLAREWKWHRTKVQKFIAGLADKGYITNVTVGNAMVISLPVEYTGPACMGEDEAGLLAGLISILESEDEGMIARSIYAELADKLQTGDNGDCTRSPGYAERLAALLSELSSLIEEDDTLLDTLADIYFSCNASTADNTTDNTNR